MMLRGSAPVAHGLPLLPWGLLGVVTVPLGILAVITYLRLFPPILFGDTGFYASALPALTGDAPLYDPATFLPHIAGKPPFSDQAPPTAIFSLLLLLPGGKVLWGLLMVAFTLSAIVILTPRLGAGMVLYAPVVVALPPILEALAWGNLTALVFLMFAIAWRWPRHAGWAIGIAIAAKLMPVLAVAWLVGKRDWRGVVVALAIPALMTLAVMIATSPWVLLDFLQVRLHQTYPQELGFGLADLGVPLILALVIACGVACLAVWRASFTLAMLSVLLASPTLHMHYLTLALVPALGWISTRSNPAVDRFSAYGARFGGS